MKGGGEIVTSQDHGYISGSRPGFGKRWARRVRRPVSERHKIHASLRSNWMDVHEWLQRLHLLCATHALAPSGALSPQIFTLFEGVQNNRGSIR